MNHYIKEAADRSTKEKREQVTDPIGQASDRLKRIPDKYQHWKL